jgi:hydrogenase nickel incorporation protein HypA/HybF
MIKLIEEQKEEHGFDHVEKIHLSIGEFSSVVPEALEFGFQVVSQGTVAEGAELVIKKVPLIMKCEACNEEFHTEPYIFMCPKCEGTELEMVSGAELQIESIEV